MSAPITPAALSKSEAADYLRCSERTLDQYVIANKITPRYHGAKASRPVFRVADLDALLDALPDTHPRERGAA